METMIITFPNVQVLTLTVDYHGIITFNTFVTNYQNNFLPFERLPKY